MPHALHDAAMTRTPISSKARIAAVAIALAAASCSTTRKTVGGWFGGQPEPAAAQGAAAGQAKIYYANVEGLKVYSAPTGSSKVIGALSLNEKVTRSKVQGGYAYVESAKS